MKRIILKVTYICLFNDKFQLENLLFPSMDLLKKEKVDFDLILVNSKENGYTSASQAYNRTLDKMWNELGDVVCFIHQDIRFIDTNFHNRLCVEILNDPYQVLGVAGLKKEKNFIVYSNLQYWNNKEFITRTRVPNDKKIRVSCLDEACFATSKLLLKSIRFDEKCCFHWHLYAHDFCFNAILNVGAKIYVVPEIIYHKFDDRIGLTVDRFYLRTLWNMIGKYHGKLDYIGATCFPFIKTNIFGYLIVLRTYLSQLIVKICRSFVDNN